MVSPSKFPITCCEFPRVDRAAKEDEINRLGRPRATGDVETPYSSHNCLRQRQLQTKPLLKRPDAAAYRRIDQGHAQDRLAIRKDGSVLSTLGVFNIFLIGAI
jgi:hypothetical protein